MKLLRLGDPHVRPSNLAESEKLMLFVESTILSEKVNRLEILGDLHHTHAIVRLEVLDFWDRWLPRFANLVETIVIVGNHDMGSHYSKINALNSFKKINNPKLKIVDSPTIIGKFAYLPYIHDSSEFIIKANELADAGCNVLVCHGTFAGSQYDNGFYAPTGINPDEVRFNTIITGHVHKNQLIANGKVDMPGTASWQSSSDTNEDKAIWIYEHDEITGKTLVRKKISTAKVCTPILSFSWKEGDEAPVIPEGSRSTVELIGTSAWISKQKSILKGTVSIQSKITDVKKRSEERKVGKSLSGYLQNTKNKKVSSERLLAYAKELGIVE